MQHGVAAVQERQLASDAEVLRSIYIKMAWHIVADCDNAAMHETFWPPQVQPIHWDQVIQAMAISQQQRSRLSHVRRAHLAAVRRLLGERQQILKQLQVRSAHLFIMFATGVKLSSG